MADATPPEADRQAAPQPGGAPLWDNAQALTGEMLELGQVLVQLLMAELRLAAHHLPRALAATLGLAVVGWLSWVGLSMLAGWGAYAYFGNVGAGLAAFLALNLAVTIALALKLRGLLNESTLPATRRQLRTLMTPRATDESERTAREHPDERNPPTPVH